MSQSALYRLIGLELSIHIYIEQENTLRNHQRLHDVDVNVLTLVGINQYTLETQIHRLQLRAASHPCK